MQPKEPLSKKQVRMHKDFFVRTCNAIEDGYYSEALSLEYASIEGRLEVILGVLGLPCNKNLDPNTRKDIKISHRISCMNHFRKHEKVIFERSKIPMDFFAEKGSLSLWIKQRNIYTHGYYKNAEVYYDRKAESEKLAKEGLEYARLLYNESKRLRRFRKSSPEIFTSIERKCRKSGCKASNKILNKAQAEGEI